MTDLLKFKQHVTKPFCLVFRFLEIVPEQFSGQLTLQPSSPTLYHSTTRATSQMFQNGFRSWLKNSQKQKIACKNKPQYKMSLLHNAGKTRVCQNWTGAGGRSRPDQRVIHWCTDRSDQTHTSCTPPFRRAGNTTQDGLEQKRGKYPGCLTLWKDQDTQLPEYQRGPST